MFHVLAFCQIASLRSSDSPAELAIYLASLGRYLASLIKTGYHYPYCAWGGGRGGEFTPILPDFFNKFFFTQAKSFKFFDFKFLSFRHNVAKFH